MEDKTESRKRPNSGTEETMFRTKKTKQEISSTTSDISNNNNENDVNKIGTLGCDFGALLKSGEHFDVTFVVGSSKKKIEAHRLVLAVRSKVFRSMLFGYMKEATSNIEINIPDVEPEIFKKMMHFMYSDTVSISPEDVLPILYCARKYDLGGLTEACLEFLNNEENEDAWDEESLFVILEHAAFFEEMALMDKAMLIVGSHAEELLESSRLMTVAPDLLKRMVMSSSLAVSSELVVIEACLKWAEHECKRYQLDITPESKRKVLRDILPHLRFPTLSAEELSTVVRPTGILTSEEILDLYEYMTLKKKPIHTSFPTDPRRCKKPAIMFDTTQATPGVTISAEGRTAKGSNTGSYSWIRGTAIFTATTGTQYSWKVQIDTKNNLWGPSVGVCTQQAPMTNFWAGNETYWWFLDSYTGFELYGNGTAQFPDRNNKLKQGDIVTVFVDLAKQEISWAVNDEDANTTTKRLKLNTTEPLYPLFGLHGGSQLTIL